MFPRIALLAASGLALSGIALAQASPAPLVVISIDGMKPEYITQAQEHGLKVPVPCGVRPNGASHPV